MKINELNFLSGVSAAKRAKSKNPKVAARGKQDLAKAGARRAGSPAGVKKKKTKMAGIMYDKWSKYANQLRIETGGEPTIKQLKTWVDKFMGGRDLSGIDFPTKFGFGDRNVKIYFRNLVNSFYEQGSTSSQPAAQASEPAAQAAEPAKAPSKQWKTPSGKSKRTKKDSMRNQPIESIEKRVLSQYLKESDARIQHAEDVIFWEGSKGANRVIKALHSMADKDHQNVTLKWDGSPAIVFGRDSNGQFIFTDKSGFYKKDGVGRTTSPAALKKELLGRSGGKFAEDPSRIEFANKMAELFRIYEKAVPKSHAGFFKGDLLYFETPPVENNHFVFKPNVVTYSVGTATDLGERIAASTTGVVIHRELDEEGYESPFTNEEIFEGDAVFVVPTITTVAPVEPDTKLLDTATAIVKKQGKRIDALIDESTLRARQLTDLPKIFYSYMNSKVDTGLHDLGNDFKRWLESSRLTNKKKANVIEYIEEYKDEFISMWKVVTIIKQAKNNIIEQFDSQGIDVKQYIGDQPGGEGYVLAHPEGDIKLVPRSTFTAANRAVAR